MTLFGQLPSKIGEDPENLRPRAKMALKSWAVFQSLLYEIFCKADRIVLQTVPLVLAQFELQVPNTVLQFFFSSLSSLSLLSLLFSSLLFSSLLFSSLLFSSLLFSSLSSLLFSSLLFSSFLFSSLLFFFSLFSSLLFSSLYLASFSLSIKTSVRAVHRILKHGMYFNLMTYYYRIIKLK